MIDLDDRDRQLQLINIGVVIVIVFAIALIVVVATSVDQDSTAKPDTEWNLTRINESHIRIQHAGGDPVKTDRLTVTVDGRVRHPRWTASILTDGEYGVVRADERSKVILLWKQSKVERDVLEHWQLPERTA